MKRELRRSRAAPGSLPGTPRVRSGPRAAVVQTASECYLVRNSASIGCAFLGWPQTVPGGENKEMNWCWGNANEGLRMACLDRSEVSDWYKNFPGCTSNLDCKEKARTRHHDLTGSWRYNSFEPKDCPEGNVCHTKG